MLLTEGSNDYFAHMKNRIKDHITLCGKSKTHFEALKVTYLNVNSLFMSIGFLKELQISKCFSYKYLIVNKINIIIFLELYDNDIHILFLGKLCVLLHSLYYKYF